MGIAANKAVVARYFEAAATGDLTRILDVFSEDMVWVVPGEWELAGTYRGEAIRTMVEGLSQFEGGLHFSHRSITAEEDRVVVQTAVEGRLADGRHYRNEIIFLFVVQGDRIVEITEMPDILKSRHFWIGGKA